MQLVPDIQNNLAKQKLENFCYFTIGMPLISVRFFKNLCLVYKTITSGSQSLVNPDLLKYSRRSGGPRTEHVMIISKFEDEDGVARGKVLARGRTVTTMNMVP